MADATARDGAADAPAVAAAFARYLQTACVPLLGESPALVEAFERDLAVPPASAVVEQFVSDSAARVLQVHAFVIQETAVEGEGTDGAPRPVTYRLRVNLGVEYVAGGKQRGHDTVCFIKRGGVPLTTEVPLTQQLQVMTLGLGKKGDMANKTAETSGNTTEDDDDEDKSDNDDLLAVVYNYVHESFGPLVNEYSRVHQPQTEVTNLNESVRGLPAIRRRMKELELALLQYQQNIEIPEVNLISHPTILRAAELVREKGLLIDNIEALGLEDKVNDVAFLNEIQGGVNRWIKEIQKVTRLISEPLPGTTTQEINFWCDLHRALLSAQSKLASPEVEITLALLKRAKRYLATVTFNADHGLGPALQRVSSVMALMKDFPMNSILSATDITQLTQGVVAVFTHLKKIRVADEYKLSRLLHLVEVMSSDLTEQIVSLMRGYNLIQMPFDQFENLITQCKELFTTWHRQVAALYELAKELSKRRGTMFG